MTSWISFAGVVRRRSIAQLLSFMLMLGAVAGAALTCFDDTSIEDDVLEVEAVLDAGTNAYVIAVTGCSLSADKWQGQLPAEIGPFLDTSTRTFVSHTPIIALRI